MFITRRTPLAYFRPDEGGGEGSGDQAPQVGDTPAVNASPADGGTPGDPGQQEINWQKRYEDLRPEFDRTNQEAAELRRYKQLVDALHDDDPDTRRQAAELLGLEFDEDVDDTEADTPMTRREFEAWQREQQQQARQQAQVEAARERDADHIDQSLGSIEQQLGRELDDQEVELLAGYAIVNRDGQGRPNVQRAWEILSGRDNQEKKRWAQTKKAPRFSQVGQQGVKPPKLDTLEAKDDYILERIAANRQDS